MDVCTQPDSDLLSLQPAPSGNAGNSLNPPLSRKQKRVEAAKKEKRIEEALLKLGEQVDCLLQDAAAQLDIEVQMLTSRFLAARATFHESKPTPWQGFVSKMSAVWRDEEDGGQKHKGAAYLNYVVKRISDEGLYTSLSSKEKDELVLYAQELRDSKISAGSARTVNKRLNQGNVRNELYTMAERLQHLHEVTGIEAMMLVVRGKSTDGLKPAYFVSNSARQFLESHISIKMDQFINLLEISCISGAVGIAEENEITRDKLKRLIRDALRASLCAAALSTASDGSGPTIQNADEISAISWTNYKTIVLRYKAVVYGWPMTSEGAMIDPSSIGGKKLLETYLSRITDKLNPTIGFKRLAHEEWVKWCDENSVSAEGLGRMRRVRSDKGKSRKIVESGPILSDAPKSLKRKNQKTIHPSQPAKQSKPNINNNMSDSVATNEPTVGVTQDSPWSLSGDPQDQTFIADPAIILSSTNTPTRSFTFSFPIDNAFLDIQDASTIDSIASSPFEFTPPSPLLSSNTSFSDLQGTMITSPTYPLIQVPAPEPNTMSQATSSATSPGTPRAARLRRRKDPFIVMSPESYASRTPRTRRARTASVSSLASRPNSPSPLPTPSVGNPTELLPPVEPSTIVAPTQGSESVPFGYITHPYVVPEANLAASTPLFAPSIHTTQVVSLYANTEFASPSE
ncbi:hypothetical protein RSOLAG22IIIB_08134 [Rhizoctonia solani]|uniref:Uncharacterized protein n=1 Tax=Rhizoctonia solani TaxID=456999 RepID=A0A0K6FRL9_9AGAM|nr:hypothetical protein RSOLAG22IIIB_08134 [Rhizoctonia solani]